MFRRLQQQRQQRIAAERVRSDLAAARDRRAALAEYRQEQEQESEAVRALLAARAAEREAAAEALAALPEDEREARLREQDERRAASQLKMAESLRSRGHSADACKWLERLVEEFPETSAAEEAREVLAWLPAVTSGG